jgi:hypothetical protein
MRKILSILVFCLLSNLSFAQRIGVEAGGALTGLQQSTSAKTGDFNVLSGALGGPNVEFKLSNKLGIYSAALFEFRAGRYGIEWYKPGTTYTRNLFYGQIPLNLTYRLPINKLNNWVLFAGPRLNIGLFGNTNEHYYLASTTQIDDNSCFAGSNSMNRFDVGFDLGFALELQRFQFKLNYTFPITNSVNVSPLDELKQHQLQLSVGLSIWNLSKKKNGSESGNNDVPVKQ